MSNVITTLLQKMRNLMNGSIEERVSPETPPPNESQGDKVRNTTASPHAPKNATCQSGEEELITQAFCELFVANCLEVRENPEAEQPQYTYRVKGTVDLSLLNVIERRVARHLCIYQSYPSLLSSPSLRQLAAKELQYHADLYEQREPHAGAGAYQRILADALRYNPPATGC